MPLPLCCPPHLPPPNSGPQAAGGHCARCIWGFWNVVWPRLPMRPGLVLGVRVGVVPSLLSVGGLRGREHGLYSVALHLTRMDVVRAGARLRQAGVAGRVSSASRCPAPWLQSQTLGFSTCQMSARVQRGPLRLFTTGLGQEGQGPFLLTEGRVERSALPQGKGGGGKALLWRPTSARTLSAESHCSPFKQVLLLPPLSRGQNQGPVARGYLPSLAEMGSPWSSGTPSWNWVFHLLLWASLSRRVLSEL